MSRKVRRTLFMALSGAIVAVLAISCGRNSEGGSGGESPSPAVSSTSTISSTKDVPSTNLKNYDYSQGGAEKNANAKKVLLNKSLDKGADTGTKADFSLAGCESYELKKQITKISLWPDITKCYVSAIIDNSGGKVVEGIDKYNYAYISHLPPDAAGYTEEDIALRVGIFNNKTDFRVDMCLKDINDGNYKRIQEARVTTKDGKYEGHMTQAWADTNAGLWNLWFGFNVDGLIENYTLGTFDVKYSFGPWTEGAVSFTADAKKVLNTVSGSYNETWSDIENYSGAIFTLFDQKVGSTRFSENGVYPATSVGNICDQNTDSDVAKCLEWHATQLKAQVTPENAATIKVCYYENPVGSGNWLPSLANGDTCEFNADAAGSFSIVNKEGYQEFNTIADSDSSYFDIAKVATLPTVSKVSIGFDESWDCVVPSGSPDIDGSKINFAACDALKKEVESYINEDHCFVQGGEAEVEDNITSDVNE